MQWLNAKQQERLGSFLSLQLWRSQPLKGGIFDVFLDITRLLNKKEIELEVAYWWVMWNARDHFLFKKEKLDALI